MNKFLFIILIVLTTSKALADQPKDWQLGFQNAASETMRDIVNFHDNLLLPIIIAITALCRLIMMQNKEMDALMIVGEASAVLILAGAAYLMSLKDKMSLEKLKLQESKEDS